MNIAPRYNFQLLTLIYVFLFAAGCKKDQLHLSKVQQLNSNTKYRLNRVRFLGDSVCIAAGGDLFSQAVIVRSLDGGYTWTATEHPEAGKAMNGLGVSPDGKVYLCGVDGSVLRSNDSGKSWGNGRIGNWLHYVGASFATNDTGVFVSTVLQRQSNITVVDNNFNIISDNTYQFGLNDVYMVSASTGYVVGYGAVMKTTDHTRNWTFQDVKGDNFTAMDIHGNEIWMCGANGGIFHTTNGGNSWETLRNGNNIALPRYWLRTIVFKDKLRGWCAGDEGRLIYTDDGGNHWMEYERFTKENLRSMTLCPNGDLLVAGDNGVLFRLSL